MLRSNHQRIHGKPPPNPWGNCIAKKRCPRCRKVRAKWFGANHVSGSQHREMWQHFEGKKVCHICCQRVGLPPVYAQVKTSPLVYTLGPVKP